MLTKYQTDEEKRNEILSERDEIIEQFRRIVLRAEYIRACKKAKSFPFYYLAHYKSKKGNRYTIITEATDRKKGSSNPLMSVFTTMDAEEGRYMFRFDTYRNQVNIFTPHFFKRYRERFLKDDKMSTDEIMLSFNKRNPNLPKDPDKGIYVGRDGYILAKNKCEGMDVCVTFVSFDMLKGDQIERFNSGVDLIERYEKDL